MCKGFGFTSPVLSSKIIPIPQQMNSFSMLCCSSLGTYDGNSPLPACYSEEKVPWSSTGFHAVGLILDFKSKTYIQFPLSLFQRDAISFSAALYKIPWRLTQATHFSSFVNTIFSYYAKVICFPKLLWKWFLVWIAVQIEVSEGYDWWKILPSCSASVTSSSF